MVFPSHGEVTRLNCVGNFALSGHVRLGIHVRIVTKAMIRCH